MPRSTKSDAAAYFAEITALCVDNPVLFVTQILKAAPEPWQAEFLSAVADNAQLAVRSGHGVGKTTALAWLVLWWVLFRTPAVLVVTAITAGQIDTGVWTALRTWFNRLPAPLRDQLELQSDKLFLKTAPSENYCVAKTASKDSPDALAGIHSENMIVVVDEASGVPEPVFEHILGLLTDRNNKLVLCGNPLYSTGFFFDVWEKYAASWWVRTVSMLDCARTRESAAIQQITIKYGADSNYYRSHVLGLFPLGDDNTVVPRHLVESATQREAPAGNVSPVIWGVDVARFGDAKNALAKRQGPVLLEAVTTWSGLDTMATAGRIHAAYLATAPNLRPEEIYIDAIGVGAGVADRCRQLGLPVVDANVGESAPTSDSYMRLRDELWWRAREWFESLRVSLPDQPELIAQLCGPRYRVELSNKTKVESKLDMKRRGLPSPDLADAFCLTLMNTSVWRRSDNPFYRPLNMGAQKWVI